MRGVNQYHSYNIIWVLTGVDPDVVSSHRMSNENVWTFFTGCPQHLFQFGRNLQAAAWFGTGVAPAISGAIVGTHAGELRDLRLHHEPVNGRAAKPLSSITVGEPQPLQSMFMWINPAWTKWPRCRKCCASRHLPIIS
jgi:hypothetical protein